MVELKPPPGGRDRKIRLEVPLNSVPERAATERRGVQWTAAIALIGLLGLALAIFVVLPRMVETRQEAYRGGQVEETGPNSTEAAPKGTEAAPKGTEAAPKGIEAAPKGIEAAVPGVSPQASMYRPPGSEAPSGLGEPAPSATEAESMNESQDLQPEGRHMLAWGETPGTERDPFVAAMSQGLAALDGEDYAAAHDAFLQAKKLRPGSPESADGLARAETGLRRLRIDALHGQAKAAEEAEDWHAAVAAYEAVLKIDPSVGFALEGAERARDRADLDDRLRYHLANEGRLSSSEVLEEAARLLRRASEASAAGGVRLQRQVETLGGLVESYSQPVRVELRSDNLTEVTVYRVGRLGTFESRDLSLRPGTYTVVGSRDGYRDVRRRLTVEPGQEPTPLEVRCEEKI